MKTKTIAILLTVTIACAFFFYVGEKEYNHSVTVVEPIDVMPHHLSIAQGDIHNTTGLKVSYMLNRENGKYVNLYVENKGSNDVVTSINDSNSRTFNPGYKGHISVELTQDISDRDNEYVFKVVTGKNGGKVNVSYKIAQQDTVT